MLNGRGNETVLFKMPLAKQVCFKATSQKNDPVCLALKLFPFDSPCHKDTVGSHFQLKRLRVSLCCIIMH